MVIWRSKDFPRSTVLLLIHFLYIAIEMQNSFEGFLVGSETNLSVFSVSISSPGLWGWLLKITPQNCGGYATSRVARRTNWTLPITFGDAIPNGSCSFQQDRNTTPTSMFRCIFVSFQLLSTTANHWWVVTFEWSELVSITSFKWSNEEEEPFWWRILWWNVDQMEIKKVRWTGMKKLSVEQFDYKTFICDTWMLSKLNQTFPLKSWTDLQINLAYSC